MSFSLRLNRNEIIVLPSEKNLQERIEFCEKTIEQFSDYFYQHHSTVSGCIGSAKVCARLEAMANYILEAADKDKEYTILSKYKDNQAKINEVSFSFLEKQYNFDEKD